MSILSNLSGDLAAVAESSGRGVVNVERRRNVPASGIVWSVDGLIVTANHAIREDEGIRVSLGDDKPKEASLVGRDPTTDLALVRVSAKLEAKTWVDTADLRVGHLVLAIGRPGKTIRAALGIISALGAEWRTSAGGVIARYIQTDASSYPGFSGGPLVNMESEIIGMNTSGLLRNTTVTVPAATVRHVVEELLQRGYISRGFLGISTQPARLPSNLAAQIGQETALLVMAVEPGSPAESAGMVFGDTIVSIGGQPIRQWDDLLISLGKDQIGKKVQIRVLRAGKIQELAATVIQHP